MPGLKARRNIFDFDHIDTTPSKGTIEMLKSIYAYYHKPTDTKSCIKTSKEKKNLFCNIVAGKAIITSAVARGITLNTILFTSLSGFGLVVKMVASFNRCEKRATTAWKYHHNLK